MILKCTSFEQMKDEIIKQDMSIVVFGAGAVGTVTVPEVLRRYGLLQRVLFYVDNSCTAPGEQIWIRDENGKGRFNQTDSTAPEQQVQIRNRAVDLKPVSQLNCIEKNTVIIIAISRYADAIAQLDAMPRLNTVSCYIMPIMCIHNFCMQPSVGNPVLSKEPLIPKKIHYIWLGKKPLPESLQKCIDSWKKHCPDYEIIQWNESNYDITKNAYMKDAYEVGAYSFVSDYARLDILYQYGGIYMDTDVEVVRNLDPLRYQEAFCSVEKWQIVNSGGCISAVKGHPMMREFLEAREHVYFLDKNGKQNRNTCGFYDTGVLLKNGYQIDGTTQNVNGMNVYAYDYFHPYDYMSGHTNVTEHTYSIHWFHGGWLDAEMKSANEKAVQEFDRIYQLSLRNSTVT